MVNVLAPRAGGAGFIATLLRLGVQIIDVVTGAGAITKYTVGPAWTGAEFPTIGAAIAQADADANPGTSQILVYPGDYFENVTVPATLERCSIVSSEPQFALGLGAVVNGTFVWNLAPGGRAGMGVSVTGGPVTFNDAGNATRAYIEFAAVTFLCDVAINSVATSQGADVRAKGTLFADTLAGNANTFRLTGGAWLDGGTFVLQSGGRLTGVDMRGLFNVAWNLHSNTSAWSVSGGCQVWGRLNFSGASCDFRESYIDYPGPPAVTDACTSTSFCQGNSFAHNAGPGTFAYVKTGTSLLHPGGNTFLEGQEYPWYDIQAGTVHQGGAETDDELRRFLDVDGVRVLTAAEVGSQRKTTVMKIDAAGSVQLPPVASLEPGCSVILKDRDGLAGGPGAWNVLPDGAETIDGAAFYPINVAFRAVEVQTNGVGWSVIGAYL